MDALPRPRDISFDAFSRAFVDPELHMLLGLNFDPDTRLRYAGDESLLRALYATWRQRQTPHSPAPAAPFRAQTHNSKSTLTTGTWQLISVPILLVASWIAMGVGWLWADKQREFGTLGWYYGQESAAALDRALIWAFLFATVSLGLAIGGTYRARMRRSKVAFSLGIAEIVAVVFVLVVVATNAFLTPTWY